MAFELSVIIPTWRRSTKLQTLMAGLAATASEHERFEVILVVDGWDEQPLAVGDMLPAGIEFVGLTKDHAGPAAARNHAIEHARGRWLVFYDDDARVEPDTIPGHLAAIRAEPDAAIAHLGRVDWPDELLDAPWSRLLAESSMLFFWDRMVDRQTYGFRHFWTTNLSVPRELVHLAGGFDEGFPTAIHEDIELGWRLQERFGLRVRVHQGIRCLHDHGLSVNDYFAREHKSGRSALAARTINPAFHDAVWPWIGDAASRLQALHDLLLPAARRVLEQLQGLEPPSPRALSAGEREAIYLAHLPLKRMAFLHGYLDRPFEDFQALVGLSGRRAATEALAR